MDCWKTWLRLQPAFESVDMRTVGQAAYMERKDARQPFAKQKQSALAKPSAPVVLVKQPRVNYGLTRNAASEICVWQATAANDILEVVGAVFRSVARERISRRSALSIRKKRHPS